MSNIMVSVCVLSYNHEKYLRDCLEGIVMQRTTFPIEAWVHDDASTDKSQEIIKEYQQRYPEIIKPILQTENQYSKKEGSILAMHLYPKCIGKYVALCEGDDYWTDPYKLQKQVDFMESHSDYSACVHNAVVTYGDSSYLKAPISPLEYDIAIDKMLIRWTIPTASILYRAEYLPHFKKPYPNGDYALELWLSSKGKIHFNSQVMSVYRRHLNSASVEMSFNPLKMYKGLVDLLKDAKEWYGESEKTLFEKAIVSYEEKIKDVERNRKYPYLKYLKWRTYKRWLFDILHIQRIPVKNE